MARRFQPGPRNPEHRQAAIQGKLSEGRFAWVRTVVGQMVLYVHQDDIPGEPPFGDTLQLMIPVPNRKPITMNFSAMTEEELDMVEKFFLLLFEKARPVVRLRDKVAQDAFAAGDDSYSRVYRQVPQFVVRERALRSDDSGVHNGPEDVPEGDEPDGDPDGGLRGDGDDLAPGAPEDAVTEDDGPTAD